MKECPTRVRTGVPPSSVTSSGTAREVIRLWITVAPGHPGQLAGGDQRGEHRRADQLAALVDDEAAVGVAVEGQPEVGAGLADRGLQVDEVGRLDRVGLVVREGAVELEVERHDVEVEPAEHRGRGVPGHPVAGVDDDREPAPGDRREAEQVLGVVVEQVPLDDAAGPVGDRGVPRGDEVADGGQAGVRAEGHGARRGTS